MSSDIYGMSDVENYLPEKDEEMPIDPIILGTEGSPDSRFQVLVPEPEVERSDQDAHIASTAESSTHAVRFPVNTEQGPSSSSAESTSKTTTHSEHGQTPTGPATAPPKGKRWILVSDDDESEQQLAKKKKKKQRRKKQKDEVDGSDDPSQKKQKGRRQRKKAATEEGKEAAQPPPKPYGRRPLIAKEVKWKDIPDWRDRTDCPLFKLPAEVLDLCFGLGSDLDVGLSCRDYVALAGASRYFRQQLTDDVFHEILHERRVINSPNCTKNCADRIFSTTVDDWSNPPKRQIGPTIEGNHWHPRGTRSEWSEAHYIVYKEEQAVWQYTRKRQMEIVRDERLKRADWKLRKDAESVEVNGQMRRIVAYAKGRSKGQPPPKKDDQGIPEDAGIPPKIPEREPEPYITWRIENQEVDTSELNMTRVTARANMKARKAAEEMVDGRWIAPDSEYGTDDEGLDDVSSTDIDVLRISKDSWPSKFRYMAAQESKKRHIIKTEAMKEFKVSEAELLCLKHSLVPNPMNGKGPIQVYLRSAVEALAYRSHGGPIGHKWYLIWIADKMAKIDETRKANIEKAKKDGTWVQKKKKHQIRPFDWKYRNNPGFVHECDDEYCDCHDLKKSEQGTEVGKGNDGQAQTEGEGYSEVDDHVEDYIGDELESAEDLDY